MLTITQRQADALKQDRLRAFAPKVDAWLAQSAPAWAAQEPAAREPTLREMLALAERS